MRYYFWLAVIIIIGFAITGCPNGNDEGGGGTAPTITTTSLPAGRVGTAYNQTLTAKGDAPITWSHESGALPAGLTLAADGTISGTPTAAGASGFTVKAANAAGSKTEPLSITITGGGGGGGGVAPTITTTSLPNGTAGTAYNQTLTATGDKPVTWSLAGGTLPTDLSLAPDGTISGTPTAAGTSGFTVKAANAAGSKTKQLSITIDGQKPEIGGMVWIQGGTFQMGSPTSEPDRYSDETRHQVTLTGFYMGKNPVTQAEYEAVMTTNPSHFTTPVSPETSTADRPVETVSWYEAIVFCNKLSMEKGLEPAYSISGKTDPSDWGTIPGGFGGDPIWDAVVIVGGSTGYRLPTEAQWEYACRAGTETPFNTGDNITADQANYDGDRTTRVGSFAPNTWGLYDMHGNVSEWCWDWYSDYGSGTQNDPTGPVSGDLRVTRGGSWYESSRESRSACRGNFFHFWGFEFIGFRLVLP